MGTLHLLVAFSSDGVVVPSAWLVTGCFAHLDVAATAHAALAACAAAGF